MSTGTAEKIQINKISLTSEKFRGGKEVLLAGPNQDPVALEFNIYEHINLPYLTGSIQINDDNDIFRSLNLDGTERVTIEFRMPLNEFDLFSKTFVVTNIQAIKSNDYNSLLSLSLMDETGFYDRINKVSRHYQGTGERMIELMLADILGKKLFSSTPAHFKPSSPNVSSYIVPYQTCFDSVNHIKNRMHTVNGMPYFCHASIATDDLVLTDLESIFERGAFNKGRPFIFSQASTNNPIRNLQSEIYNINTHSTGVIEDTLNLSLKGGLGSRYTYINPTQGTVDNNRIDILKHFDLLIGYGIIKEDQAELLVNKFFVPDPSGTDIRTLSEYDANVSVELATSTNPVNPGPLSYTEYTSSFEYELHLIRSAVLSHLDKTKYTINLPGMAFLSNDVKTSVGNLIEIEVFKNIDRDNSDIIDEKKSGEYVMLTKRHSVDVIAESHIVSLDISRLTNMNRSSLGGTR